MKNNWFGKNCHFVVRWTLTIKTSMNLKMNWAKNVVEHARTHRQTNTHSHKHMDTHIEHTWKTRMNEKQSSDNDFQWCSRQRKILIIVLKRHNPFHNRIVFLSTQTSCVPLHYIIIITKASHLSLQRRNIRGLKWWCSWPSLWNTANKT